MPFDAKTLDLALAAPGAARLSRVLIEIEAASDLDPVRRRDLASAVRRVSAALGREPSDIPGDPVWLRPRIAGVEPAALGVARKTWTNVLSDFRAALSLAGVASGRGGGGCPTPLPAPWAGLRDTLVIKRHRIGLSRFLQFCASLEVAPEDIDDEVLAAFRTALEQAELRKDPATLARDVATFWNQAADTLACWPQRRLTVPDRRNRVALPEEVLPVSFREDVGSYLDRLAISDLMDPDGPPQPLAPETIKVQRQQILRFASALVHRGRNPDTIRFLADLVEPDAAREGLRYFLERNHGRTSGSIYNTVALLKSIARWHVRSDDAAMEALAALGRRLAPRAAGMTPKNRARLRPFDDEAAISALLRLPDRLVARAARAGSAKAAARDVEIALAIAILIHCPVRIRNLRTLAIDRQLIRSPGGDWRIVVPAEEVKNGKELDFPLTGRVGNLLDVFIRDHRKTLNPHCGALIFSKRSAPEPVDGGAFGKQISRVIRRETGLEVNPHLFRHISAKIYLRANPGAYEVVRRLLGHSQTSSTVDAYAGFETDAAARSYGDIIETAAAPTKRGRVRR